MMESALYLGRVAHERMGAIKNAFAYDAYFLYLDLAELDVLDRELRLFSHNGRTLTSLQDKHHGPRDGSPLRPWIDGLLAREGIDLQGGPVRLLAFPSVLGQYFYPVSFWYCFDREGAPKAILAEVNNTFGEHHGYLLHRRGATLRWGAELTADKVFHVSPFIAMDGRYTFTFTQPDMRLAVRLLDTVSGEALLFAGARMERRPLTDKELLRAVSRYGPMSARALVLIHWQAVRLLAKGVKYLPHPPGPAEEVSL